MLIVLLHAAVAAAPAKPNVLHMVFDDFRPDLPFYGQKFVHAPNLWKQANKSLVFDRAYCQIAVCSPSRNSFMTGRRPNSTMVWNFFNSFREAQCPDTQLGTEYDGDTLKTWTVEDAQNSGGAGGCCTTCKATTGCVGWVYKGEAKTLGGTCRALGSITSKKECVPSLDKNSHPTPCLSGGVGEFPAFTTLPEHFKNNGYLTLGVGKLFHDGGYGFGGAAGDVAHPAGPGTPPRADPISWTNNHVQYPNCTWVTKDKKTTVKCPGLPAFVNSYPPSAADNNGAYLTPAGQGECRGVPNGPYGGNGGALGGAGCTEDVPDNGEGSGQDGSIDGRAPMLDLPVFKDAKLKLEYAASNLKETGQPFFLNVGIKRPHLVWRVPVGVIAEHYNPANFTPAMPQQRVLDQSINPVAWTPFFTKNPYEPLDVNATLERRRFYYAAITWADYCAGQVLDALEEFDLTSSTIVVIHADHGWHLGEYNMWEKRTVWELGTRVPFMIHVPWLTQSHGMRSGAPVELIDVFPTLADLANLGHPTNDAFGLEGVSLKAVLVNPALATLPNRDYALSTYPRCPPEVGGDTWNDACIHATERTSFKYMGYTIRTVEYRYTEFVVWNRTALAPDWNNVFSKELYDHRMDIPNTPEWEARDDFEDKNMIDTVPASVVAELAAKLRAGFGAGGRPMLNSLV